MEAKWKIDRRIPLAMIMTVLMQMAGGLIWATQLNARVRQVEQQAGANITLSERFARLEERLENVKRNTEIMKGQLDHLVERLVGP